MATIDAFEIEPTVTAVAVTLCEVRLDNVEVMADIGALAAELGVPQPLRIHVSLEVRTPAEDHLSHTFDYATIRAFAEALAGERIVLIETFARRLADLCLQSPMVLAAEVTIEKPQAVPGCLAGTRVRLRR